MQRTLLADRDAEATTIEWTYNDDGTVDYMTKEDGTVVTYTSDNAGRVTQIDITRATGVVGTTQQTFDYDPAGRRVRATDNNDPNTTDDDVTVTWAYDSLGRLIQESQKVGSGGDVRTVTYDYTSTRRSAVTYPNGRQLDYAYHDFGGALETLSDNGPAEIVRYEYIGGRTLKREMANGVDLDMRDGAGGTLYDALGRPTEWKHLDSNQNVVIGFSYGYDRVGNKRWQRVLHDTRDSQRYAYDSASRLTAFVRGDFGATDQDWCDDPAATQLPAGMTQAREWTLDGVGNWSQTRTKVGGSIATESRSDTSFNEYSSIGGTAQSHDANGNLIDDGTYEYAWDGLNRLVSVCDKASQATIVTYAYDTGNRRMRKDVGAAATAGQDTDFAYAGWQLLEETAHGATGTPRYSFVWGNHIDEVLCRDEADGDRLYYHQNTLMSVSGVIDGTGALVECYAYDPYGAVTVFSPTGTARPSSLVDVHHLYTGRERDPETGLQLNRNRYYDAERGRWVSRDPIGWRGGLNLYEYCSSTPITTMDSMGKSANNWTWGEIGPWAVVETYKDRSTPPGLGDAKASIGSCCSKGNSCNNKKAPGEGSDQWSKYAWENITKASGEDKSGGGVHLCVDEKPPCGFKCATCRCDEKGKYTRGSEPSGYEQTGAVTVSSKQGGTLYFFNLVTFSGWCTKKDQTNSYAHPECLSE